MDFHTRFKKPPKKPIVFTTTGRTHQSFKDECDINNIMRKFQKTGVLPDMIKQNPQYGDFSSLPDYQASLDLVMKAQLQFQSLASHVRERFSNDPAKFLEFATDSKNMKEMVRLGLAVKREPEGNLDASSSIPTKAAKVAKRSAEPAAGEGPKP